MSVTLPERQARERQFHDQAFATGNDARQPAAKFYAVGHRARGSYESALLERAPGRQVLEYGCGPGSMAFPIARAGGSVVGIDISDVAIAQARARARAQHVDARFEVMDAERLAFPSSSFDLICGRAILHHLDLARASAELARVLRPGGEAIFWEPLGHNPFINLYRRSTPAMRTVDEHPLLIGDLRAFRQHFSGVQTQYFTLCPLLAVPFRSLPGFGPLNSALEAMDRVAFRFMPALGKFAWQVVIVLSGPTPAISRVRRA